MSLPKPPPVPTIREEDCADPKRLVRILDQFTRDVNAYAQKVNDELTSAQARLTAGGL